MNLATVRAAQPWGYLAREAALILLWAYVLLVGGTINGLLVFPVQAASAFLIALLGGAWLAARLWRRVRLPRTGLEWAAIVFVGVQFGAALLSQDVRRSLPLVAQSIAYLLIFYCAYDLTRSGWPAELTEKTLLIVGGIVIGLAWLDLAQAFLNWAALVVGQTYAPEFQYRVYSPLGDANLNAACLVILSPLALARALASTKRVTRLMLGVWLAGAAVALWFTSSRGGLAGAGSALGVLALAWIGWVSPSARTRAREAWAALRARPIWLMVLGLALISGLTFAAVRVLSFRGSATQGSILFARSEFWPAALNAFKESPLWGKGPGTFPTEFMRGISIPPERPYLHAHSLPLNTAAETGLLGLAATGLAVVLIGRAWWRARGKVSLGARARWAAVAASWAGFMTHSFVDDHTRYLAAAVPLAVLLALALAEETEAAPVKRLHPLWLLAPGLAAAAFTGYALRAYALSEQAVTAGQNGDWARAAQGFDRAAAADPSLAFYWEQAGYAYGRLAAQGDQSALAAGIDRLEHGRALEPYYSVTYGNLAALYWQAQRSSEAVAAARHAMTLAPTAAVYPLNLGIYEEALGQPAEARAAYQTALKLNFVQAQASFWSLTSVRQAALAEWQAQQATQDVSVLDGVRRQIAAGQVQAAEQTLVAAWRQDRQSPLVYVGLAEVARSRGDLTAAQHLLDEALWVQTLDAYQQVEAVLLAAEVAQARGQTQIAFSRYASVFSAVTEYGSLGWGSGGWTPHAFFVFQRRALPVDVLPQVTRVDFPQTLGRRLLPFGELAAAAGQRAQAITVFQRLLALDPTLQPARERLQQLASP